MFISFNIARYCQMFSIPGFSNAIILRYEKCISILTTNIDKLKKEACPNHTKVEFTIG